MEKIDEQLANLSKVELPKQLHKSIMIGINYKTIRTVLLILFSLLLLNFIVITWHINTKLIEAEFSDMIQDLFQGFDMSLDFLNTIVGDFFEVVSPLVALSLLLSLVGILYIGKKIIFYNPYKVRKNS